MLSVMSSHREILLIYVCCLAFLRSQKTNRSLKSHSFLTNLTHPLLHRPCSTKPWSFWMDFVPTCGWHLVWVMNGNSINVDYNARWPTSQTNSQFWILLFVFLLECSLLTLWHTVVTRAAFRKKELNLYWFGTLPAWLNKLMTSLIGSFYALNVPNRSRFNNYSWLSHK